MKCPKCGVENRKSAIQCIRCGSFFDEESNKIKNEKDHLKEIGKTISEIEALELYIGEDASKVLSAHNKLSFFIRFLWFYLKGYFKVGFIFQIIESLLLLFCFYMDYSYVFVFLLFGLVYYFCTNPVYLKWARANVKKLQKEYEKSDMSNEMYKSILQSPKNRKWSFGFLLLGIILFVPLFSFVGHYYYETKYAKVNVSGWRMKNGVYVYDTDEVSCQMTGYHSSNEKEYKKIMKKYNLISSNGTIKSSSVVRFDGKRGDSYDSVLDDKVYNVVTYTLNNSKYDVEFFIFSAKDENEIFNCYEQIRRVVENIEIKK